MVCGHQVGGDWNASNWGLKEVEISQNVGKNA
jgi:hypothetical protein